ncbi:hypothetical protein BN1051_02601 [Arthrobacter saudimassiliensis]|uniref:DUF1918 domain-containing protein n=1 Tax=Arthrobacter saudimassiliensis TaxID=1461584 RepID=A0A078MSJ9_9MICC|nr:hypothetical protein BN1051_02601 [Arthrobacter saudimassiliensis]
MSVSVLPENAPAPRMRRIRNARTVHRGDLIEARAGGRVAYRGEVRDTAPGLSTIWLRDEETGGAVAISTDEFELFAA